MAELYRRYSLLVTFLARRRRRRRGRAGALLGARRCGSATSCYGSGAAAVTVSESDSVRADIHVVVRNRHQIKVTLTNES
jgi:hypothetical protein